MKKYILIITISLFITKVSAQILTNTVPTASILGSNAFLDASSNYSSTAGESNNNHKGLVFPDVILTTFQFENVIADGATFPSYYDGMVVYNTATGTTLTTGIRSSTATAVTPGFYYFSNPNGATNGNVTAGVWTALGGGSTSGSVKDITSTEVVLDKKIDGALLYAIKGTFTATGTSTAVTVTKPTGMTGYYSMVTYKDGKSFRSTIYSFNTTVSTGANVITGNGVFAEVYPAGTYNYVLEYFK